MTTLRYNGKMSEAFAWWLHDAFAHPVTGTLGLFGRLIGSLRVMALAHHAHNATAPSNDALADYLQAAYRAGCNETSGNPRGGMTPDEQDYALEKYRRVTKDTSDIQPQHAAERLKMMGSSVWEGQAAGRGAPECEFLLTAKDDSIFGRLVRAKFNNYELEELKALLDAAELRAKRDG